MGKIKEKFLSCDLAFIGSGISSSFTLLQLLQKLIDNPLNKKISITIIDKYEEFYSGIPYGSRSGSSVLLITSLKNFLPMPELNLFKEWLTGNKEKLFREFELDGGDFSKEWLSTNSKKISNNQWDDLFIPRRFFGYYIHTRVKKQIEKAIALSHIQVKRIQKEVFDLHQSESGFLIDFFDSEKVETKKVVLALGSLPTSTLGKTKFDKKNHPIYVNDPYVPKLDNTLTKIAAFVDKKSDSSINVLIIGANASGIEMLYKLNDCSERRLKFDKFYMLSTLGLAPDSEIDFEKQREFKPIHLNRLGTEEDLTAKSIADAAGKDLDLACDISLGAASTVDLISGATKPLLHKLTEKELRNFACFYGNEIGRRQRCAGIHYARTIGYLQSKNKFEHLVGRFKGLKFHKGSYRFTYVSTSNKKTITNPNEIHVVINCTGSANLETINIPILIKNLQQKNYCAANESKIGFKVNESFETIKNLYVIGPLLAGNIFEGKAVWHAEHCGRIIWLSGLLADKLYQQFQTNIKSN